MATGGPRSTQGSDVDSALDLLPPSFCVIAFSRSCHVENLPCWADRTCPVGFRKSGMLAFVKSDSYYFPNLVCMKTSKNFKRQGEYSGACGHADSFHLRQVQLGILTCLISSRFGHFLTTSFLRQISRKTPRLDTKPYYRLK